jgi:hypothetical protein
MKKPMKKMGKPKDSAEEVVETPSFERAEVDSPRMKGVGKKPMPFKKKK